MVVDPIQKAIRDFNNLLELIEKGILDKGIGSSFRTRTRSILSMIDDIGLVPALSFCFANATKDSYDKVMEAWGGKKIEVDKEEGGYALYLFLTLSYLQELGFVKDVKSPVSALESLINVQALASKLLRPYCVQIKRLAEAVFGEKQ